MANNISFDFNKTVQTLRQDFQAELADVLFANMADPHIERILDQFYVKTSSEIRDGNPARLVARNLVQQNGSYAQRDSITNAQIVSIRNPPADEPRHHRMFEDLQIDLLYGLAHEVGHLMMKYGIPLFMQQYETYTLKERKSRELNLAETSADSFAVLYLLHKGLIDKKTVYDLGLFRAFEALTNQTVNHLTTIPVDQLLLSAEDANFMSLSPAEIKALADAHAARFDRASFGLMEAVLKLSEDPEKAYEGYDRTNKTGIYCSMILSSLSILPEKLDEFVHMLGAHCLASKEGSIESHLSTRILMDMFETNEIRYRVTREFDLSRPEFDDLKRKLQERIDRDPLLSKLQSILKDSRKPSQAAQIKP